MLRIAFRTSAPGRHARALGAETGPDLTWAFGWSQEDKRRRMLGGPSPPHGKKMAILLGK